LVWFTTALITSENSDWAAARVSALRHRAASARKQATALCGDATSLAAILDDLQSRRRECAYPAEPNSVRLARGAVAELATRVGVTGEQLDAIRLAVSEAASNVVVHAYPGTEGTFRVRAVAIGRRLTVFITDNGCGPDVPSSRPGLGLGLGVISASSDLCTIRPGKHGGTHVGMRWKIEPSVSRGQLSDAGA
jgi:anti-sigma regulatory factor (Ser/Thr protein kinase)